MHWAACHNRCATARPGPKLRRCPCPPSAPARPAHPLLACPQLQAPVSAAAELQRLDLVRCGAGPEAEPGLAQGGATLAHPAAAAPPPPLPTCPLAAAPLALLPLSPPRRRPNATWSPGGAETPADNPSYLSLKRTENYLASILVPLSVLQAQTEDASLYATQMAFLKDNTLARYYFWSPVQDDWAVIDLAAVRRRRHMWGAVLRCGPHHPGSLTGAIASPALRAAV